MGSFDVRDYGARGDGEALDTGAVQAALDAAGARGGRVVVPPGRYLCGTIELRSHTTLDLQPNAVIAGSPDLGHYVKRSWGHHKDITPWHLVLAEDVENIAIIGEGVIDGRGPAFWEPERPTPWTFWRPRMERVSPMVELVRCRDVRVENVTLRDSAGWHLHLHDCDGARLRGLVIRGSLFGPNGDGIDLSGCRGVTVSDCDISCGDDAIALKTTEFSRSCEDIVITNCVLETSCVAVRLGFESRQDFRRVSVSNLAVKRCSRVIDLRSIEGAVIEDVVVSGVTATTNSGFPANRPIEMTVAGVPNVYKEGLPEEHPHYGMDRPLTKQGAIRRITLRDIDVETDGRVMLCAEEGLELSDILLDNVELRYAMLDDPSPFTRGEAGFLPRLPEPRTVAAALVACNARRLAVDRLRIHWPRYPVPEHWRLLRSDCRFFNADFYRGHEAAVRRGDRRVTYKALWARNVAGGRIDLRGIRDSEGGEPADVACTDVALAT
jgi:hypothetical protein